MFIFNYCSQFLQTNSFPVTPHYHYVQRYVTCVVVKKSLNKPLVKLQSYRTAVTSAFLLRATRCQMVPGASDNIRRSLKLTAHVHTDLKMRLVKGNLKLLIINLCSIYMWQLTKSLQQNHCLEAIVAQLAMKSHELCGTRRFISALTRARHRSLSWGW